MASKPKVKIVYRYRERQRAPAQVEVSGSGDINVGTKVTGFVSKFNEFRQIAISVGTVVFGVWAFLLPYVNAQAEDLLRDKLVAIGMDPSNIQTLNESLKELTEKSDERDQKVDKILEYIQKQELRQQILPPIQMQAAPQPIPLAPVQ